MTTLRWLAILAVTTACGSSPSSRTRDPAGERTRGMANCPSTVPNTTTDYTMTPDGVDVVITASSEEARGQLVEITERSVRMGPPGDRPAHSGRRGGPGTIGFCPIVHEGAVVTAHPTASGVVIHLRAAAPDRVAALQDEVRARVEALGLQAARAEPR